MSKHEINATDESAQTMAEYTVVLGLIALVTVTTYSLLSNAIGVAVTKLVDFYRLIA